MLDPKSDLELKLQKVREWDMNIELMIIGMRSSIEDGGQIIYPNLQLYLHIDLFLRYI